MVASSGAVFAATALEKQNGRVNGVAAPLTGRKAHPADANPLIRTLHLSRRVLEVRVPQAELSTSSPSVFETEAAS
ncbi:hypothetical protein GCM10018777_56490 [Streptomyces albogriseolus]|nr:hypothetical protein GCM10010330_81110 [Streptomyces tendae]GHG33142.1 hypothetical protein GCM10018777_56490 [Streptomyces viridodiastaticus]